MPQQIAQSKTAYGSCNTFCKELYAHEHENLYKKLSSSFETVPADNHMLQDSAYKVRYKVYCEENHYEKGNNGREVDQYDYRSPHVILKHKHTDSPLGTVRLVTQDPENPFSSLPLQSVCKHELLHSSKVLPVGRTAEMSRFCMSQTFYRDRWDKLNKKAEVSEKLQEQEQQLMPLAKLLLIQGILETSIKYGITHFCAAMEPWLIRILASLGIFFRTIGVNIDFHGKRQLCYIDVHEMFLEARLARPDIWYIVTNRGAIEEQFMQMQARI